MSDFIIFDTEFEWDRSDNPYPPGQIRSLRLSGLPEPSGKAAIQVIIDKLNILIRPRLNPSLSPYFCTLTGITAEAIAREGLAFEEAASRFMNFCGNAPTFAYGDDAGLFIRNARLVGTELPPAWPNTHARQHRPLVLQPHPRTGDHQFRSVARTLGLSLDSGAKEMGEHNALYDCYSIHAAMKHLVATRSAIVPE